VGKSRKSDKYGIAARAEHDAKHTPAVSVFDRRLVLRTEEDVLEASEEILHRIGTGELNTGQARAAADILKVVAGVSTSRKERETRVGLALLRVRMDKELANALGRGACDPFQVARESFGAAIEMNPADDATRMIDVADS
jgi:hypothetical protein